jgi:phospholipid/cholesterol/gamma-HCH transport system permease protein
VSPDQNSAAATARLKVDEPAEGPVRLRLSGSLAADSVPAVWPEARRMLERHPDRAIEVDCGELEYCDSAGIALLVDLLRQRRAAEAAVTVDNLAQQWQQLLDQFDLQALRPISGSLRRPAGFFERVGRFGSRLGAASREQIAFLGEASASVGGTLRSPQSMRWHDTIAIAEEVGVNALPIVALIACLMGIIMAFQSAVSMRQFGAEIFVANLVGLSLLRELGPLMTAILLAGRSAAAFAAEIGTMKVNDEISALVTMGLDPVRFLVAPRILAALVMTPLLTIFADAIGLLGGGLVMLLFHIPLVTYFNQLLTAVTPADFFGGLAKSFVFGLLIAGVGCLRGLQTGQGASAVGISATRAVVSSLVLIVVADGLFAVLYYHLGI